MAGNSGAEARDIEAASPRRAGQPWPQMRGPGRRMDPLTQRVKTPQAAHGTTGRGVARRLHKVQPLPPGGADRTCGRARHPRPGCQEFFVSCTVVAICTQSTLLSGSRSAPHARAPATVGVCGTVGATPGTTWSNGAYTRRSPQARSPAPRRALAANPNPTDDAISRRRVRHHRARSLPAAGGVHPVWARGGHVTGTWPRLYFVKTVLLICVFTEKMLFGV